MRRRQIEAERSKNNQYTYYLTSDGLQKTDGYKSTPADIPVISKMETVEKRKRGRPKGK